LSRNTLFIVQKYVYLCVSPWNLLPSNYMQCIVFNVVFNISEYYVVYSVVVMPSVMYCPSMCYQCISVSCLSIGCYYTIRNILSINALSVYLHVSSLIQGNHIMCNECPSMVIHFICVSCLVISYRHAHCSEHQCVFNISICLLLTLILLYHPKWMPVDGFPLHQCNL